MSTGDVLIVLASLSVVLALLYPSLRARTFRSELDDTIGEVEALRLGAEGYRRRTGGWPAAAGRGTIPAELLGAFPGRSNLARGSYTLEWTRWEMVDSVPGPPPPESTAADDAPPRDATQPMVAVVRPVGGILLHSRDDRLLGGLLERYGRTSSFVRDTTWTLLLPGPAGTRP